MKTLKITPEVHKELTNLQAKVYNSQGIKLTFSEVIMWLIIDFQRPIKVAKEYNFDDK